MSMRSSLKCLIMSANISIGSQIASLMQGLGWQADVVQSDLQALDHITYSSVDIVIADIDTVDLGGLAILAFCHHRYPAVITYAIARADDNDGKRIARDACGCQGYFYLVRGKMEIDLCRGMATTLAAGIPPINRPS